MKLLKGLGIALYVAVLCVLVVPSATSAGFYSCSPDL